LRGASYKGINEGSCCECFPLTEDEIHIVKAGHHPSGWSRKQPFSSTVKKKKKPATLRHGVIIAVDRSNGRAGPVGPFRAAPTTTQRRG